MVSDDSKKNKKQRKPDNTVSLFHLSVTWIQVLILILDFFDVYS